MTREKWKRWIYIAGIVSILFLILMTGPLFND